MGVLGGGELKITVDTTCTLCGQCVKVCPCEYLAIKEKKVVERDDAPLGCITCGHCAAVCPEAAIHVEADQLSRNDVFEFSGARPADYDELVRLLAGRRSIRQFKDQPVPKEVTDRLLEAAQLAPAGLPPSSVKARVISGKERVRAFAFDFLDEVAKMAWMFSKTGIWALRPFMSAEYHREMREKIAPLYRGLLEGRRQGQDYLFYDAPLVMIFTSSGDMADAVIATTYVMVAAESLGLGSCMIGTVNPMLSKTSRAFHVRYGLPLKDEPGLTIVFGYPRVTFHRGVHRRFAHIDHIGGA